MMTMEILKVNIPTLNSNKSKQKNIDNFVPKKSSSERSNIYLIVNRG